MEPGPWFFEVSDEELAFESFSYVLSIFSHLHKIDCCFLGWLLFYFTCTKFDKGNEGEIPLTISRSFSSAVSVHFIPTSPCPSVNWMVMLWVWRHYTFSLSCDLCLTFGSVPRLCNNKFNTVSKWCFSNILKHFILWIIFWSRNRISEIAVADR